MKALLLFLCLSVPQDGEWHRCFAWYPIEVDAYDVSELRGRGFRYRVWLQMIETRFDRFTDDDDDQTVIETWRYRLAK